MVYFTGCRDEVGNWERELDMASRLFLICLGRRGVSVQAPSKEPCVQGGLGKEEPGAGQWFGPAGRSELRARLFTYQKPGEQGPALL